MSCYFVFWPVPLSSIPQLNSPVFSNRSFTDHRAAHAQPNLLSATPAMTITEHHNDQVNQRRDRALARQLRLEAEIETHQTASTTQQHLPESPFSEPAHVRSDSQTRETLHEETDPSEHPRHNLSIRHQVFPSTIVTLSNYDLPPGPEDLAFPSLLVVPLDHNLPLSPETLTSFHPQNSSQSQSTRASTSASTITIPLPHDLPPGPDTLASFTPPDFSAQQSDSDELVYRTLYTASPNPHSTSDPFVDGGGGGPQQRRSRRREARKTELGDELEGGVDGESPPAYESGVMPPAYECL